MGNCLSCAHGKAIGAAWAYCKTKQIMVTLSQSCEFYADGLEHYRRLKRDRLFEILLQQPKL